jgi:iron-sulfur cluster repair protein YtfE (RIC family)
MIRLDHTHVLAAFHRYSIDAAPSRKAAVVNAACAALEIHAQLEEEIFYPALKKAQATQSVLDKSLPEHDEMRVTIAELRATRPDSPEFDELFMKLMRAVLHHVADEETILLPDAERTMGPQLRALGAAMNARRFQLLAQRPVDIAINQARTFLMAAISLGTVCLLAMAALAQPRHGRYGRQDRKTTSR